MILAGAPIPALRAALEAVPVDHEGKQLFLLRDLEGLTQASLAISPGGMMIASFLDGKRTAAEVQGLFAKATGNFVKPEEITELAAELERAGLLETPEIAAKRESLLRAFLNGATRPASHAGAVYPKEPLLLSGFLGRFLQDPKGPKKDFSSAPVGAPPAGLVCPHIDFNRGGPAYGWAFQALSERRAPDLIVALGVAHMSPNSPWIMTPKAYETPYGPMTVDTELYDEIKQCLWYEPRDDEWAHRDEHSLEFAAVWLKYLWREKTPPWVPILCSSFERFSPDQPPSAIATVDAAIAAIAAKLAARVKGGQKIMILSAIDLAHVGPRFGDDVELNPELETRIEKEDRASLAHALKLDADSFYRSVVADEHWRKVCGLSSLYTSLRLIKAIRPAESGEGKLLAYGQAPDPAGGIVSFASAIF